MEISKESLALIVALAAVIGSIASALTGALSALAITWLTKRSEERKHFREVVINAAIKNWEKDFDHLASTPHGGQQYPLDDYILMLSKTADLILDKKLNSSNVVSKVEEIARINLNVREYRRKQTEELRRKGI